MLGCAGDARRSTRASTAELSTYLRATGAWTGSDAQLQAKAPGLVHLVAGSRGVPARMKVTRRQFVKGGVAAFTVTFAAPEFLSDLARAQGARVAQSGRAVSERRQRLAEHAGPYNDPFYYSRRPTHRRFPPAACCRSARDSSRVALGLHPRLTGLKQIFDQGRLALIQRTGYENQSRSHFLGTDIWSTADPEQLAGTGWVGRYLDSLPSPVDPLVGWNTTRHAAARAAGAHVAVPAIREPARLRVLEPEHRGGGRRRAVDRGPHRFARAGRSARAGVRLRQRASGAGDARSRRDGRELHGPSPAYPNTGFAQALQAVAGAMAQRIGTRVFYVHDRRLRHALRAERRTPQTAPTTT